MRTRIGAWLLASLSLLAALGFMFWTFYSEEFDASQARLHLLAVAHHVIAQVAGAGPISDWNFPLWSMVVWVIWLIAIYGTGLLLCNRFRLVRMDSAAWSGTIYFSTGFIIYGLSQLVLGIAGYARLPIILLFPIPAIWAFVEYRSDFLRFPKALWWHWKQMPSYGNAGAILFLAAIACMIVPALAPPIQSDGLRYHLGAVQAYLKLGQITYLPSNAYSNMPFLVEMHFLGALACGAPEACQLMHFTLASFTALGIYALARRLSDSRDLPILAGITYLGTPMSVILAGWAFTDHGISLLLLASIMAAITARETSITRNWVFAGLMVGGLLGTKYTMGPIGISILVIFGLQRSKEQVAKVCASLVVVCIVGGVWYLKNLYFTANPFYPLASRWFPGGEWTTETDAFLKSKASAKGMGKGFTDFILAPWYVTFKWTNFETQNPGPTILITCLGVVTTAVISIARKMSVHSRLLTILLLACIIWFTSYQSNRLLLPVLALGLAITPYNIFSVVPRMPRWVYSAAFVITATYGFAWAIQWSWVATGLSPAPLPYLFGSQDKKTFRYKSMSYARAFDYLNDHVAKDEKVLLIGEHRIYGASFSAIWSDWFDTPILADMIRREKLSSVHGLLSLLDKRNVRWILINESELSLQLEDFKSRFSQHEWTIFEELSTLSEPTAETVTLPPGVKILHLKDTPQ